MDGFNFTLEHVGINCDNETEALQATKTFELFGMNFFQQKNHKSSVYSGSVIEWMKSPGRGKNGHLAIGTSDIENARRYLEENGIEFDQTSAKYNPDGSLLVIYAKAEICGFAFHLINKG